MKRQATRRSSLEDSATQTAERLAAIIGDPRTLTAIRDALRAELLDFAERYGSITEPSVLRAAYPALCERARFDPLAPFVAALNSPAADVEVSNADALNFPKGKSRTAGVSMPDDSLAHRGIFEGDWLTYESAEETVTRGGSIGSGELVALSVRVKGDEDPPVFVGELRVEGDRVHLVAADPRHPTHTFRVRDVVLLGRVSKVMRYVRG